MGNLGRLGVHTIHNLTGMVIARALAWEITHGERRQQDKDDGVQDKTAHLGGTLAGCNPATEHVTCRLVRRGVGDHGIKDGWDNVKFSSVGHFLFTDNKIHRA